MFETMLSTLFTAAVLWVFGLDSVLTSAINEIFRTNYTVNVYWLFFFVMGLVLGAVREFT